MPGKAPQAGLFQAGVAGFAGGLSAALVLVVGSDVADALVQPDAVVVGSNDSSARSVAGSSMVSKYGCSSLMCPFRLSIHAWSVGLPGRPKCWAIAHNARNSRVDPRSSADRCRRRRAAPAARRHRR